MFINNTAFFFRISVVAQFVGRLLGSGRFVVARFVGRLFGRGRSIVVRFVGRLLGRGRSVFNSSLTHPPRALLPRSSRPHAPSSLANSCSLEMVVFQKCAKNDIFGEKHDILMKNIEITINYGWALYICCENVSDFNKK